MKVGLVACSTFKAKHAAPACELYTSPLFKMSLRYLEARCDVVYVVSAKHGLVELTTVLEPYDEKLGGGWRKRLDWARSVANALIARHGRAFDVEVCMGAGYSNPIFGVMLGGAVVGAQLDPMRGMFIGERLGWLRAKLGET